MTTARLEILPYTEHDGVKVWSFEGLSERLIVCFTGIGTPQQKIQPYEMAATVTNRGQDHALFISDGNRSWFNRPGVLEFVVKTVEGYAARVGAKVVSTIGHSMGGYMALMLPGFTSVKTAIGFNPQVSVHPDVVGDCTRWKKHRRALTSFRFGSVMDHIVSRTQYFVFHGGARRERLHRERFAARENLELIVVPNVAHNLPLKFREQGILSEVTEACLSGQNDTLKSLLKPLDARFRTPGTSVPMLPFVDLNGDVKNDLSLGENNDQI